MKYVALEVSGLVLDGQWISRGVLEEIRNKVGANNLAVHFFVVTDFRPDFRWPVVENVTPEHVSNMFWDAEAILWSLTDLEVWLDKF